jgi:hypothetical protein
MGGKIVSNVNQFVNFDQQIVTVGGISTCRGDLTHADDDRAPSRAAFRSRLFVHAAGRAARGERGIRAKFQAEPQFGLVHCARGA